MVRNQKVILLILLIGLVSCVNQKYGSAYYAASDSVSKNFEIDSTESIRELEMMYTIDFTELHIDSNLVVISKFDSIVITESFKDAVWINDLDTSNQKSVNLDSSYISQESSETFSLVNQIDSVTYISITDSLVNDSIIPNSQNDSTRFELIEVEDLELNLDLEKTKDSINVLPIDALISHNDTINNELNVSEQDNSDVVEDNKDSDSLEVYSDSIYAKKTIVNHSNLEHNSSSNTQEMDSVEKLDSINSVSINTPLPIKLDSSNVLFSYVFYYNIGDKTPNNSSNYQTVLKNYNSVNNVSILISGYTDNIGNEKSNIRLSKERTEAVKKQLTENGIDKRSVYIQYFGEEYANPNSTSADRRVTVLIIKNR